MAPSHRAPTLSAVADSLKPHGIRLLEAPRGDQVPVSRTVLHDRVIEPRDTIASILLGIGVAVDPSSATNLLQDAGRVGSTGVVLRGLGELSQSVLSAAKHAGVAVFAAPEDMAWQDIQDHFATAILTAPRTMQTGIAAVEVGDLFALANAVASMIGGAVLVVDPRMQVLAYSSLEQPIDEARRGTILERRPTRERLERFALEGVLDRLYSSEGPIRLEGYEDMRNRLAVAVRAGRNELLGSIWVTEGEEPLGARAEETLREASAIAAIHLLRRRAAEDLDRQIRREFVRAVLYGDEEAQAFGARLGLRSAPGFVVLVFAAESEDQWGSETKQEYLLDLVTFYAQTFARQAASAAVTGLIYTLYPTAVDSRQSVSDLAQHVVDTAARDLGVTLRVGVGGAVNRLEEVHRSRDEAEQALQVAMSAPEAPLIAFADDVVAQRTLIALRDWLRHHPERRLDCLQRIIEHDLEHRTSFARTLRSYLMCFGDIRAAAKELHVHENTVRYRLQRIGQLSELDLSDGDQRLVAALELRTLMFPGVWGQPS